MGGKEGEEWDTSSLGKIEASDSPPIWPPTCQNVVPLSSALLNCKFQ